MRRYTLVFSLTGALRSDQVVRPIVENLLLRVHPRITYKLHIVKTSRDGDLIVELEAGTDKNNFRQVLEVAGRGSSLILKDVLWGWESTMEEESSSNQPLLVFNRDPLYKYPEIDLPQGFPFNRKNILIRLLSFSFFTLLWLAAVVMKFVLRDMQILDAIYIPVFMLWLMQTNELPFHFRQFPVLVECGSNLKVYYWPSGRMAEAEWIDIWGLDYSESLCTLHASQGKLRFILTDKISGNQKRNILQTIVQKASLRYVGGNLIGVSYRRPSAPEK